MSSKKLVLILLLAGASTAPQAAFAYIGPGAGLSAIGTLLGLIGAVILALVGFVWYPVKRMMKARKKAQEGTETGVEPSQE